MRETWIGTTWKMNKTLSETDIYFETIRQNLPLADQIQMFVIVPFTHLTKAKEMLVGTNILLGAQNMHWEEKGEYTGEISPVMLSDIGVELVEIGHSERRTYFNEDDYSVNRKVIAALNHGLRPLICVGEQRKEREFGVAREVVARQVKIALHGIPEEKCGRILIAYEPVWAIGQQGIPATAQDADEIQAHIRRILIDSFGSEHGDLPAILYGGSVDLTNAGTLIQMPNVNGLFIGRAGLDADMLLAIVDKVRATLT